MTALPPFDGREVTVSALQIVRTGKAFADSLAASPAVLHDGDTVHVLIRATVNKVTHDRIKGTDELRRGHTATAVFASIVTDAEGARLLDRSRRAVEQAAGVQRIPGIDESIDRHPSGP